MKARVLVLPTSTLLVSSLAPGMANAGIVKFPFSVTNGPWDTLILGGSDETSSGVTGSISGTLVAEQIAATTLRVTGIERLSVTNQPNSNRRV